MLAVVMLSVEVKGGVPDAGLNAPDTPFGIPDKAKATLCAVPDIKLTEIVVVALTPGVMLCCIGEAEMEKSKGCGVCTFSRAFA